MCIEREVLCGNVLAGSDFSLFPRFFGFGLCLGRFFLLLCLGGSIRRLPYPYGSGGSGKTLEEKDKSTRVAIDGTSRVMITDEQGGYRFTGVAPGAVGLNVSYLGF